MIKGSLIKNLRKEKNISQRQLAKNIEISNTELSRIESGERQEPSPQVLMSIGKELGINYLELFYHYGYIDKSVLNNTLVIKEKAKNIKDFSVKELVEELARKLT